MKVDYYAYSNAGGRPVNEDDWVVRDDGQRCTAVVCDGLGGHNCGEIASETAIKTIADGIAQMKTLQPDKIYEVLQSANDELIQMQNVQPELRGMRTTTVGCVLEGNTMYYFNSGDSRFYYFSNGNFCCMSRDHSISQMSVSLNEIDFDSIRSDSDRNKLLIVLGEKNDGTVGSVYKPETCKPGDAFLLCSDGFWEYVLEDEMEIDLSKAESSEEWVHFMLIRLLLRVNKDNDNFTVIGGIMH